jgi:hypothetical protein
MTNGVEASVLRYSLIVLGLAAAGLLSACSGDFGPAGPSAPFSLEPFKTMAREAPCADVENRLFLIDKELVFWLRRGNCSDAMYGYVLYGSTPDDVKCFFQDSIAGGHWDCPGPGFEDMFETIKSNLREADLGLGPDHLVEEIPF